MNDLFQAYRTFFGTGDALYRLFSPYRICPLGAHVDHQHGLVTGFAFDSGIEFLFSETETGKVEMASLSFEEATDIDFYIGCAMNPAHQNNKELSISFKLKLVDELIGVLKDMNKNVRVNYF